MKNTTIAIFVGSLRKGSYNLKAAKAVLEMLPENLTGEIIPIGDLPFFNEDLEGSEPESWLQLRQKIKAADGLLFFTPEYNRSVPAVLKNALDVGSRPYGQNSWAGKPAAIVSVTIGTVGAFGANHHLRQSLVFVDVPVMAQPEAYISNAGNLFNEKGKLTNESTQEFLQLFVNKFAQWVKVHTSH